MGLVAVVACGRVVPCWPPLPVCDGVVMSCKPRGGVHGSKAAASFDAASMMANDASLVMLSCMAVVERRAEAEVGPVDAGAGLAQASGVGNGQTSACSRSFGVKCNV